MWEILILQKGEQKNMKKSVVSISLIVAMIFIMAVPAFADWGNNVTETTEFENAEGMYIFDDTTTRAYLFLGEDKALVVDTMYESSNVLDEVRKITDLPLEVVLTHGHPDHIGGISAFSDCTIYIDEDDAYMLPDGIKADYIKEGDKISVGDYEFEVIEIPGHTRGSIALLDKGTGILITGDSVQEGPVMMFDEECDMETYQKSMEKLEAYKDDVKYVFAGHHDYPNGPEYITYCAEDAKAYLDGKLEPVPVTSWNGNATVYYGEHVSFQLPALEEEAAPAETPDAAPSTGGSDYIVYIAFAGLILFSAAAVVLAKCRKN